MTDAPQPPAEGALIEDARRQAGLSVRAAARRAGISEGWWRQVVKGYQTLSGGGHGPVSAPAETIARMAAATGHITSEQLAAEGRRPDAALLLEAAREHVAASRREPDPDPFEEARPPGWSNSPITPELVAAADDHWMEDIEARIAALAARGIRNPAGSEVFPDSEPDAAMWDAAEVSAGSVAATAWTVALAKERRARIRGQGRSPRHGSAGA